MLVKIISARSTLLWYTNMIGNIYDVLENDEAGKFMLADHRWIWMSDCAIVNDALTQQPVQTASKERLRDILIKFAVWFWFDYKPAIKGEGYTATSLTAAVDNFLSPRRIKKTLTKYFIVDFKGLVINEVINPETCDIPYGCQLVPVTGIYEVEEPSITL